MNKLLHSLIVCALGGAFSTLSQASRSLQVSDLIQKYNGLISKGSSSAFDSFNPSLPSVITQSSASPISSVTSSATFSAVDHFQNPTLVDEYDPLPWIQKEDARIDERRWNEYKTGFAKLNFVLGLDGHVNLYRLLDTQPNIWDFLFPDNPQDTGDFHGPIHRPAVVLNITDGTFAFPAFFSSVEIRPFGNVPNINVLSAGWTSDAIIQKTLQETTLGTGAGWSMGSQFCIPNWFDQWLDGKVTVIINCNYKDPYLATPARTQVHADLNGIKNQAWHTPIFKKAVLIGMGGVAIALGGKAISAHLDRRNQAAEAAEQAKKDELIRSIAQVTGQNSQELGNQINAGFGQVANNMNAGFGQVTDNMSVGFDQVASQMDSRLGQVANNMNVGFAQVANNMNVGFDRVADNMNAQAQNLRGHITDQVESNTSIGQSKKVGRAAIKGAAYAANATVHGVTNAANAVGQGVVKVGEGVANVTNAAVHGVTNATKATVHGVANATKAVGKGAAYAANAARHGLGDMVIDAGEAIKGKRGKRQI
jgi:hypothetical protein